MTVSTWPRNEHGELIWGEVRSAIVVPLRRRRQVPPIVDQVERLAAAGYGEIILARIAGGAHQLEWLRRQYLAEAAE